MRPQPYSIVMSTARSPRTYQAVTPKPETLAIAQRIAERNLERARVLGDPVAVARAARWVSQLSAYAAKVGA